MIEPIIGRVAVGKQDRALGPILARRVTWRKGDTLVWSFTVSVIKIGIEIVVCLFLLALLLALLRLILALPLMIFDKQRSKRHEKEMEEYRLQLQEQQRQAGLASFKRRYGLDPEYRPPKAGNPPNLGS